MTDDIKSGDGSSNGDLNKNKPVNQQHAMSKKNMNEHEVGQDKVVHLAEPQSVQAQASAWLAILDGSEPSDEELQAFKVWVNTDEAHIEAFQKVTAAWDELNIFTRLPLILEQRSTKHKALEKERARTEKARLPVPRRLSYFALAATVVMGFFIVLQQDLMSVNHASYWTTVGEQKTISLPDNSVVRLNTNSRIEVDYRGQARAIYLHQGEAHFDVKPNAQRSFDVYAGSGRVRAVGTAFSVSLNDFDVGVIVTEGVVEIAPEVLAVEGVSDNVSGVIGELSRADRESHAKNVGSRVQSLANIQLVESGNQVLFDQRQVTSLEAIAEAEIERRLAWQRGLMIFSGESLEEVVLQLSRYTDTKIIIKSEAARQLRIGGQFRVGDTRAVFTALEKGFGLKADYVTKSLVYLSYQE